ncbi:MAG TPA: CRISPR system precrRNA processing endoribonuclease RAMP protein Cas6 [Piscirickettsiaceae bacterium]|nr:CRISPR system precrRNA processing endoribonuclease RAMP protein Cas6 [Piscirickettsiaceae bacterium]
MSLPIVHLYVTAQFDQGFDKPEYAGSLLRGQFGRMLKKRLCLLKDTPCNECSLYNHCSVPALFDAPGPNQPVPYVIHDPLWGAMHIPPGMPWRFRHTLIGHRAIQHIPLVVQIWDRVFRQGLGAPSNTGRIVQVEDSSGQVIATAHSTGVRLVADTPVIRLKKCPNLPSDWRITLHTPLRLFFKKQRIMPQQFKPEHFCKSLWHRLHALAHAYEELQAHLDLSDTLRQHLFTTPVEVKTLAWRKWQRFSTRQQAYQDMSGLVGQLQLHIQHPAVKELIWLGAQVHIGKNTTFGLGAYETAHADCL